MSGIRLAVVAVLLVAVGLGIGLFAGALLPLGSAGSIANAQVEVGDAAPDFRLPDHTGGYVQLSEFLGDKNVVLAFYPLAWTPV